MSGVIVWEIRFFIQALLLGGVLRASYDLLLIARKIKHAGKVRIAIEDFFYWMICCYFMFGLLYKNNNGVLRGFALCGVIIGMAVWQFGPSSLIVNVADNRVKWIKNLAKKLKIWILTKKQ